MALRIEDYALIGDCHSAALIGRDGSVDWLCLPRFDSGAVFAALLGTPENGRWLLAPAQDIRTASRRYRGETLILETRFTTDSGAVTIIDFMPPRLDRPDLIRLVVGERGQVRMRTELAFRFDYGAIVPWVRREHTGLSAIAGPDTIHVISPVTLHGEGFTSAGEFNISAGERVPFELVWHPSHEGPPMPSTVDEMLLATENRWQDWVSRCRYEGPWREAVVRSLITLKALTYEPTGGIVAAPTTSLPECIGGVRNWDYRYCWLRDATFTLYALLSAGYTDEAVAWREWLLRAVAGKPEQVQSLYGVAGERRLTEFEVEWLSGYEHSRPVRIGNAAHLQFQLDVIGELLDAIYYAHRAGIDPDANAWRVMRALLGHLERVWREPDEGIWELRGGRRQLVHSKMMAWVAFDRAVKAAERFRLGGAHREMAGLVRRHPRSGLP
jgi:GH15 family glucan-1,4-alpha-glucosidase